MRHSKQKYIGYHFHAQKCKEISEDEQNLWVLLCVKNRYPSLLNNLIFWHSRNQACLTSGFSVVMKRAVFSHVFFGAPVSVNKSGCFKPSSPTHMNTLLITNHTRLECTSLWVYTCFHQCRCFNDLTITDDCKQW